MLLTGKKDDGCRNRHAPFLCGIFTFMLLFQRRFHEGLTGGSITLTFRLWDTARVKPGSRYRCHPIGVLEVDAVDRVLIREITPEEAQSAGFSGRPELIGYLQGLSRIPLKNNSALFRIRLHYAGDGDRAALAMEARLNSEDIAAIAGRLGKMDAASHTGPWTRQTLTLIESHPRIAASKLAKMIGRETAPFKTDVIKLKKLGLTQSFEVGYEVSPRGRAFLKKSVKKPRPRIKQSV
jgi:hypothetical protein